MNSSRQVKQNKVVLEPYTVHPICWDSSTISSLDASCLLYPASCNPYQLCHTHFLDNTGFIFMGFPCVNTGSDEKNLAKTVAVIELTKIAQSTVCSGRRARSDQTLELY